MPTDRFTIALTDEIAARVREEQERFYQETRLRVSLAEITRRLIEDGLAARTRNTLSHVS